MAKIAETIWPSGLTVCVKSTLVHPNWTYRVFVAFVYRVVRHRGYNMLMDEFAQISCPYFLLHLDCWELF